MDPNADRGEESHGDDCRCAFCSRELKDEASIRAGYGPVCAKNHDLPWGGPVRRRLSAVRTAGRRAIVEGRRAVAWSRRTVVPRARDAWSRSRVYAAALAELWRTRTTPPVRYATLAVCTVVAGIIVAAGLRGMLTAHTQIVEARPVADPQGMPPGVEILEVARPVLVHVEVGSTQAVCSGSDRMRRQLAGAAAKQILPAVADRPQDAIIFSLRDIPLSYALLPSAEQAELTQRFGRDAARRYEADVAAVLNTIITDVQRKHPRAVLSVLGLPIEPEQAGVSLEVARLTNERYGTVIDRLGPLVPARRFVVFGSTLDEALLARMGMREALRLREGRPIVFQTNIVWQALVDSDALDEQTYLVTRPRELEVQAALVDDSY